MKRRMPKRTQVYQRLGPGDADGGRTTKCVCATSLGHNQDDRDKTIEFG